MRDTEQNGIFSIVNQYMKDLSVENFLSNVEMLEESYSPTNQISLNLESKKISDNTYEVVMRIAITATDSEDTSKNLYMIELEYVAIVHMEGLEEESMLLGVEVPRLIFPYVRHIIANATSNAGLEPLQLNPIDFLGLFMEQQMQQAEAEGTQ